MKESTKTTRTGKTQHLFKLCIDKLQSLTVDLTLFSGQFYAFKAKLNIQLYFKIKNLWKIT